MKSVFSAALGAVVVAGCAFVLALAGLVVVALLIGAALVASAHDAPSGWRYPLSCCHKRDCAPLDPKLIQATEQGWYLMESGEVIPYSKAREAPDGLFHRCVKRPEDRRSETLCLFVPPMGM